MAHIKSQTCTTVTAGGGWGGVRTSQSCTPALTDDEKQILEGKVFDLIGMDTGTIYCEKRSDCVHCRPWEQMVGKSADLTDTLASCKDAAKAADDADDSLSVSCEDVSELTKN